MTEAANLTGIELRKAIDLRARTDPARERAQVAQLAQEFEAMLMLQMIRGMRQSMLDESAEGEGLGSDTLTDSFDVEFSRHLAGAGGFGLGALLSTQVASRAQSDAAAGVAAVPSADADAGLPFGDAPTPALPLTTPSVGLPVAPTAISQAMSAVRQLTTNDSRSTDTTDDNFRLSMPLESVTTSAYGWRRDPVNGQAKFHRGVDLRAAYGTDVPAAAAGTVVFAGERGAYGTMVVVRHESGVETRYAHLSSLAVADGAPVDAGTVIGRVGSSGRSTAPHLHFEVLVNGERVDPERAAARLGRGPLKLPSSADD